MIKKLSYLIYKFLIAINYLFNKITNRNFIYYLAEYLRNSSFSELEINNRRIKFFTPSNVAKWRIDTFFDKEPETLEWIDNFNNENNIIFLDIGANIGLYSIYAATKYENIKVIAFEPSSSNIDILTRNISLNKLHEKVLISQYPLTKDANQYLTMKQASFEEGSALNAFGVDYDFEGKKFKDIFKYKIFGNSVNNIISNNILEMPNYIKIDVDGIEHLILEGSDQYLQDRKIKSISVEINENFKDQYSRVNNILQKSNFIFKSKKHSIMTEQNEEFSKTYNYIFEKI